MGTPPKIIFRKMTLEDIPAVDEIVSANFLIPLTINYYKKCLNRTSNAGIIAELNKKIIGYTMLNFSEKISTVMMFVIAPEFRRRGIGTKLFSAIINLARRRGCVSIKLHVRAGNVAAIQLYKSCGLKSVERLKNFYALIHEDAFLMERQI